MLKKWCTDVKKEESKCEDEDINYNVIVPQG